MALSKESAQVLEDIVTLMISYGISKEHQELLLKSMLLVISTELSKRSIISAETTGKETIQ